MDDMISRRMAIDALDGEIEITGRTNAEAVKGYVRLVRDRLERLSSAQPEIIHCRDCRWRNDQNGSTAWLPCRAIVTPSDFYCGRAERRTDG